MQKNDPGLYADMLDLPHHVSSRHPPMSRYDRAAQFSAFRALTGYEDSVKEAARLTGERMEPDDETLRVLNAKLQILRENRKNRPEIAVTYFVPDEKKAGGTYVTASGQVRQIQDVQKVLVFTDDRTIPLEDIIGLEGEIFQALERGYID